MQVDDKTFSFSLDRYFACDLVMYECAVNRSIFLAKNSINKFFHYHIDNSCPISSFPLLKMYFILCIIRNNLIKIFNKVTLSWAIWTMMNHTQLICITVNHFVSEIFVIQI